MKKLLLLAVMCLVALGSETATRLIIKYDAGGNLVTRTTVDLNQPPAVTPLTPISTMQPGRYIFVQNALPKRNVGSATANESDQFASGAPSGYYPTRWPGEAFGVIGRNGGAMRVFCTRSHYSWDDPIVWPGQAGRTHLHIFFGNTQTSGVSTPTSIRTTGNSTCQGGTMNRSAYWAPAMIYVCNTAAQIAAGCNRARDGEIVEPETSSLNQASALNVYYKGYFGIGIGDAADSSSAGAKNTWWTFNHDIVSLPVGFRMIAGKPTGTPSSPDTNGFHAVFACLLSDFNTEIRTQWIPGTGGTTPCPGLFARITMEVPFMTCMNTVGDLDSPTHNAHIRFPLNNSPSTGGDSGDYYCETGYTNVVPGVEFKIHYSTNSAQLRADAKFWRLSSDNYNTDLPAGYSAHGDWFNGWDQTVMDYWVANCMVRGVDCHDGVLGPSLSGTPNMWRYMATPRYDR